MNAKEFLIKKKFLIHSERDGKLYFNTSRDGGRKSANDLINIMQEYAELYHKSKGDIENRCVCNGWDTVSDIDGVLTCDKCLKPT